MSKLQHPYPIGTVVYTIPTNPDVIPGIFTKVVGYNNHPITDAPGYEVDPPVSSKKWKNCEYILQCCVRALDNPDNSEVDEMIQLNGLPLHREGLETETLFREMQENGEL